MIIESGQEPAKREPGNADGPTEHEPVQADKCAPGRG